MNRTKLFVVVVAGGIVAACDSGDINLQPTNVDNSNQGNTITNPPPSGGDDNPCASYDDAGQTFQGSFDSESGNCTYGTDFVSDTRPIEVSTVRFPLIDGFHIFENSLFIGRDVSATQAASGTPIPQEGQGTRLIIDAGNTMVFSRPDSYVRIARGSQIIAEGTADAPITFTAQEDAILGEATESDRGLWGGLQINGNGLTNKCHDGTATGALQDDTIPSQFEPTENNPHNCHATAEGRPATYGGNNNAENSGILRYVVVKHAGFDVVEGDELNAVTLNGVGSGTTIEFVQTYTSQDDGFEMFGGAVNLKNIVAVNVGDDSIDFSEGYTGDIQYAVVMHTSGGNRCIEGDNTGGGRPDNITPRTKLRISNMTCITSNVDENGGANPSSKGDSEGPIYREGAFFEQYNSIVTSHAADAASNECLEVDDSEGPETIQGLTNGDSVYSSNLIACSESIKVGTTDPANEPFTTTELLAWINGGEPPAGNVNANNVTDDEPGALATNLPYANLIEGLLTGNRGYLTLSPIQDLAGAEVTVTLTDVSALDAINDAPLIFDNPTYLGGASADDDWLDGWTVGIGVDLTYPDNSAP